MNLLAQLWRALTRRRTADREMEEEFRFHVEMEAADLGRTGLDPAEARRRAAVAFGGLERYKEAARDGRRFAMFDDLLRDARYTLRQLRLNPVFAAVVIATLAIGIGAGTAIFSVVNSVLLRPLPFADPDRLIAIDGLSYKGEFHHFRTTAQTFDPGAFTLDSEVTVTGRGDPRRLLAAQLTPELFAVAAVALLLGGIGVYGVLAYAVSSRTREIGVRMALGAHPRDVRRLVLRHGSILAVTGALCGVTMAWAVTRGMASILFDVDPADPAIFAAVPALLIAVALLASSIPARRAARVDPLIALRTDT